MKKIIKFAQSVVRPQLIQPESIDQDDPELVAYFKKKASDLKAIAPKASDFLYFSCIMMHAAEASALDENGELRKTADGKPVEVGFDILPSGALVWRSTDPNIKPFKNNNNDIFSRSELKKAYKKWVGKPLCLDHQSSSVDHVRGIIIDTVYDDKRDRIIALCAVDKVNYPDLARKIASGYAASVSMGTAVGRAICTETGCHAIARHEGEFCLHMRTKSAYGEINVDLNPIELSIVVNPADPGAKIRRVIASANSVAEYVDSEVASDSDKKALLVEKISNLDSELSSAINELKEMETNTLPYRSDSEMVSDNSIEEAKNSLEGLKNIDSFITEASEAINVLRKNLAIINKMASDKEDLIKSEKDSKMTEKRAYFQGGGDVNEPTLGQTKYTAEPLDRNDKQMEGVTETGSDGMFPGDEEKKRSLQRMAAAAERAKLRREATIAAAKKKVAYYQGTEEPAGNGKQTYTPDPLAEKTRKEDKQMTGEKPFPDVGKVDEMYPGDKEKKEMTARASYKAKFVKAAKADGSDDLAQSRWDIYSVASGRPTLVLTATVAELAGSANRVPALYSAIATKDYGLKILASVRSEGVDGAAKIFKSAQEVPVAPAPATAPEAVAPPAPPADFAPEAGLEDPEADYAGETGTPVQKVQQISEELDNLHADLSEAVEALKEEGEVSEPVSMEEGALATTAALKVKTQKALTAGFQEALKKASELKDEFDVIQMIKEKGVKKADVKVYTSMVAEASKEVSELKKDAFILMKSLKRFAEGAATLQKKAEYADRQVGDTTKVPGYILARVKELAPKGKRSGLTVAQLADKICNEFYTECVENRAIELGIKQLITNFYYPEMKGQMTHVPNDVNSADDLGKKPTKKDKAALEAPKGKKEFKSPFEAAEEIEAQRASGKVQNADDSELVKTYTEEEVKSWMKSNVSEYLDEVGEVNSTKLAEDAAQEFDLYEGEEDAEIPEWVFDYAAELAFEEEEEEETEEEETEEDENDADVKLNTDGSAEGPAEEMKKLIANKQPRSALRAKLAQKATQFADILGKAHPSSTTLDIETKGDGAKVESLEEVHKRMEEVATAPVKVKEAAEKIQKLIVAGTITEKDFPGLIAEGLDASAVSYWKKYFGEAKDKDASSYVSELVKSYEGKKTASEKQSERVKMARAYELAYEMADKGIITRAKKDIEKQVDRIIASDDKSFEFLKTTVASVKSQKQTIIPEVGIQENLFSSEQALPNKVASTDLTSEYASLWNGRKF